MDNDSSSKWTQNNKYIASKCISILFYILSVLDTYSLHNIIFGKQLKLKQTKLIRMHWKANFPVECSLFQLYYPKTTMCKLKKIDSREYFSSDTFE